MIFLGVFMLVYLAVIPIHGNLLLIYLLFNFNKGYGVN
jgi:hypothetical protein